MLYRVTALPIMGILLIAGCTPKVLVPARVDFKSYGTVGVADIASPERGNLSGPATRSLIRRIQQAQPGTPVLELGGRGDRLDAAAVRAIGQETGVGAIMTGILETTSAKPNIRVSVTNPSLNVKAEIRASLSLTLYEPTTGAIVWSNSGSRTTSIARFQVSKDGPFSMGATDADRAYRELTEELIGDLTGDFWARWERK